jgi:uncharacterized protein
MPVRSLTSSVLRWPDRAVVLAAVRAWAAAAGGDAAGRPRVLRVGVLGSYARGDWGPGSDVDLIIVVAAAAERFERRAAVFDLTELPVAADALVYTPAELDALLAQETRFARALRDEVLWLYPAPPSGRGG